MNPDEVLLERPKFSKNDRQAAKLCGFFILLSLALLASPAVGPMRYGFPALSFIFAFFIYRQSRPFYAGFVIWLWMLAPLVRRLVEYRAGGSASPIIGSPFLVCALPTLLGLTSVGELVAIEGYPALFAGAAITYGLSVGLLVHNHLPLVASGLAYYAVPLLFVFFILRFRSEFGEIQASVERAMVWGTLVVGAYGLYQYLILAPWDALWIETANLVSIGLPEPRQMRVFSTMNSPQVLAVFLIAGIFIALRSQSKIKWLAIPFASFSLLLTQSRTAWFGFLAGFVYLVAFMPVRQKLQIVIATAISIILVLGALQGEQKAILTARLQTLTAPSEDGSFATRIAGYSVLLPQVVPNPFGSGIGLDESADDSPTVSSGSGLGVGDSSVIALLLGLGLPGTIMYVTGMGFAIYLGFRRQTGFESSERLAFRATIIALAVCSPANDILVGSSGFMTWLVLVFSYIQVPVKAPAPERSKLARQFATP